MKKDRTNIISNRKQYRAANFLFIQNFEILYRNILIYIYFSYSLFQKYKHDIISLRNENKSMKHHLFGKGIACLIE